MRFPVFVVGGLFLSLFPAMAQVSVEVILPQEQFLRDESLPAKVRVTNRSGQPIDLGAEPNWIVFTIFLSAIVDHRANRFICTSLQLGELSERQFVLRIQFKRAFQRCTGFGIPAEGFQR